VVEMMRGVRVLRVERLRLFRVERFRVEIVES
jgi:hypothetical protein